MYTENAQKTNAHAILVMPSCLSFVRCEIGCFVLFRFVATRTSAPIRFSFVSNYTHSLSHTNADTSTYAPCNHLCESRLASNHASNTYTHTRRETSAILSERQNGRQQRIRKGKNKNIGQTVVVVPCSTCIFGQSAKETNEFSSSDNTTPMPTR